MNAIQPGTDNIIQEIGCTIQSPTSKGFSSSNPNAISISSSIISDQYISDVCLQISQESYLIIENYNLQTTPNLTCSSTGSTPISFSVSKYGTEDLPSWVSIDSSSGTLNLTAPEVLADHDYYFYITSSITGFSDSVQKLVKITVQNCASSNCEKCSSSSISACISCKSCYNAIRWISLSVINLGVSLLL